MFMVSNAFWFFYSFFVWNVPLLVFSPLAFFINWQIIRYAKKYKGTAQ